VGGRDELVRAPATPFVRALVEDYGADGSTAGDAGALSTRRS
jgi:hypothetical protein